MRHERPNLHFSLNSSVQRVLLEHGRAVGVELASGEGPARVARGGSVVLSAGALGSPAILLRSGVPHRRVRRGRFRWAQGALLGAL